MDATHVWRIKTRLPERKGERCRVLARGKLNSCLVEFPDGTRVITSRWAVRKIAPDAGSRARMQPVFDSSWPVRANMTGTE